MNWLKNAAAALWAFIREPVMLLLSYYAGKQKGTHDERARNAEQLRKKSEEQAQKYANRAKSGDDLAKRLRKHADTAANRDD